MAFDARQAWVLLGDERRVARVDLASRKVLSSTRLPFSPGGIATGGGAAWVTEDDGPGLVRLDGTTGRIAKRFSVPIRGDRHCEPDRASPSGRARSGSRAGPRRCASIPPSGRVMRRIPTPLAATSVVFADGAVWVASAENGRVVKIDPAIEPGHGVHAAARAPSPTSPSATARCGSRSCPTTSSTGSAPTTAACSRRFPAGPWPATLSAGDGLWIANAKGDQIVRVDGTGQREIAAAVRAALGDPLPRRSAVDVRRRAASRSRRRRRARTLRIPLEDDAIGDCRPRGELRARSSTSSRTRPAPTSSTTPTPRGPRAGCCGPRSRPRMPDVSPDGRTYTFRIRPGFRFSPPSGQAVTAETFKATIERALSPKFATGGRPEPDRRSCFPTSSARRRSPPERRRTSAASRRAATRSRSG